MEKIKSLPNGLLITIFISCIVVAFTSGCFFGANISQSKSVTTAVVNQTSSQTTTTTPTTQTVSTTTATTTFPPFEGDVIVTETTTSTAPTVSAVPTAYADILNLFNTSANKVKTNATQVVRDYEKIANVEEHMVMPSVADKFANPIMNQFVKDNLTPETYVGTQEICDNFPVLGQSWSACITENDITSATCIDGGTFYTVTINFKDCTEPAIGTACATAMPIIDPTTITDATSFVNSSEISYYNCSVVATIDKASGNLINSIYYMPIILKLNVGVGSIKLDIQLGLDFEYSYTPSY